MLFRSALTHDLTRGLKQKNFWVMEQLSGTPGCWHPMSRTPYPGMIRAHAWQSVSRGADAIVQFRWRTARIGAEQFWHGLHDHHGKPGRRFDEFTRFSEEARRLSPLLDGTSVVNDVAMLFSHDQLNALTIQPQSDGFDYLANFKQIHRAFLRLGVGTDVINWTSDISRYKLVVAPFLFLINDALVKTLTGYVAAGGTLILTTRTGVKNMNNVCLPTQLPGPLSELAGVLVDEYDPVGHDTQFVSLAEGSTFECAQWCDVLTPTRAETVGTYASEFFAGRSAVTRNRFGNGETYYLGTVLKDDGYKAWFEGILTGLNIPVMPHLPVGVEVSVRADGERRFLFVLNLTKSEQVVELPEGDYQSVLSQLAAPKHLVLEAMGVEILRSVYKI